MTDVVCILNNKKQITDINAASETIFEYTKNEMLKMSIEDVLYTEDQEISDSFFEKPRQKKKKNVASQTGSKPQ